MCYAMRLICLSVCLSVCLSACLPGALCLEAFRFDTHNFNDRSKMCHTALARARTRHPYEGLHTKVIKNHGAGPTLKGTRMLKQPSTSAVRQTKPSSPLQFQKAEAVICTATLTGPSVLRLLRERGTSTSASTSSTGRGCGEACKWSS